MKLIKKILQAVLCMVALFCILIALCAFYPGLTEKITNLLYPSQNEAMQSAVYPAAETASAVQRTNEPETVPADASSHAQDLLNTSAGETYIPPQESELEIPQAVAGKSGYVPVTEETQEIEEPEAQIIQEQLSIGASGDEFEFDSLYYPYYAMLDDTGKHLYRQIYANALELNPEFAPIENISAGQMKNVFTAVYNDHPELFWVDTAYSCKYRRNGQCVEIRLQFNRTADNLEQEKAVFEKAALEIADAAQEAGSSYEKEKAVHDMLLDKIVYDLSAPMNQSAYSALVSGRTVCAGYARAFQYIMQQLGIPCYYCTGYAGQNHAWNIIGLEDGYYNVDTTWDDTKPQTYDYFNKPDSDFAGTHLRQDLSVRLPACNGEQYANLEAEVNEADEYLRSLEDIGISPEEVIRTLPDYYQDCRYEMLQEGIGSYTFENVIEGEELFEEWYAAYQSEAFQNEYMNSTLEEIGASSCRDDFQVEPLKDGRYLITHNVTVR